MTERLLPTPAQRRAADPRSSVWVTANAGTGKTRVLSDRVLRLLLAGARPEAILCLTFTRAAAAEMGARIERQLARWAVASDELIRPELEELLGEPPSAASLSEARRLFARVLDLPRGLNIMTIHALCQTLLKRFPLEAGVVPHFETIDSRTAEELMIEARASVLGDGCAKDSRLQAAVELLAITLAESTLARAVAEMLGQRNRLLGCFLKHHEGGHCDGLLSHLESWLEIEPGLEPPQLIARACADGEFDHRGLLTAGKLMRASKSITDSERGAVLLSWLDRAPVERARHFQAYSSVFLTNEGSGRSAVATKAVAAACGTALLVEQVRLLRLQDRIRALTLYRRTGALLRLGHAVIDAYEGLKRRGALLDFDDLIERTARLLETPGRRDWVLYKLDQRLEHLLVDEAQDTSPRQWRIVERLTEEFLAGQGAHSGPRTLFVVGDEKQSIYSFQGADLANFRAVRHATRGRAVQAGITFTEETLDLSFRSSRAVLELVDRVLAQDQMQGGVVTAGESVRHDTSRRTDPGLVEVWPLAGHAEDTKGDVNWPLPGRPERQGEPEREVAEAIARRIAAWLRDGEQLEAELRPVRAGDVLILVQRRGRIQELVIRALKQHGVPVAGADRLPLGEHIAVRDLVALGRTILLPEDDLTLAALLKSPLVGLDEDQLFTLAWDREGASLFERLRVAAASPGPFAEPYERIAGWMRQADFMPPFEFYAHVLGSGRGRERLLTRLGPDAIEPIEAFLSQALAYERGHPATLEGFLHWHELGSQEVKRDPEQVRDSVRVLTVHGAKGLEAPIVFLADAGPHGEVNDDRLLWLVEDGHELPLWRMRKGQRDPRCDRAVAEEERRRREERQRLLYVALTRARDRLYVTGWQSRRPGSDQTASWHATVSAALAEHPDVERRTLTFGRAYEGEAFLLRRGAAGSPPPAEPPGSPIPDELPDWVGRPAPAEPAAPRPLAPSRLAADEPPHDPPGGAGAADRLRQGVLVHRLLQVLPALPASAWDSAGTRLLERVAVDLMPEVRFHLLAQTLAVLRLPALAPLFAPGSRAEQPLCGEIEGVPLSGQIDRLAVTAETVYLVDYKTGRQPPASVEATPLAYLRQMAAYRALLQRIYPGREVRAALLWTQGPRLDLLPGALLDRHLAHATGAEPAPA